MSVLELAIEGYRWLVGIVLLLVAFNLLKKLMKQPFKDNEIFDAPDYMIKVHGKK